MESPANVQVGAEKQLSAKQLKDLRAESRRSYDRLIRVLHLRHCRAWLIEDVRRMYDGEEPDDDDFDVQLACICQRVGERVEYSLERLLYYFDNGDELIEHLGLDEPIEFQIGNVQHGDEVYFDTVRVGEETRRRFVAAWLRLKARGFPPPDLTLCACHCCDVLDSVTGVAGFGLFQADDRAYAVACVNIHGETLSYFSHRLRDDADLVKQAVRRSPAALGFASKRLRDDESVALAAVRSDPRAALRFVSKRLCACADFRRKLLLTARVILLSARVPGSVAAHIESYRTGDLNLDFTRSGKYRTALAVRASPGEPRPRDHYNPF